jgi:hypothetical protein
VGRGFSRRKNNRHKNVAAGLGPAQACATELTFFRSDSKIVVLVLRHGTMRRIVVCRSGVRESYSRFRTALILHRFPSIVFLFSSTIPLRQLELVSNSRSPDSTRAKQSGHEGTVNLFRSPASSLPTFFFELASKHRHSHRKGRMRSSPHGARSSKGPVSATLVVESRSPCNLSSGWFAC